MAVVTMDMAPVIDTEPGLSEMGEYASPCIGSVALGDVVLESNSGLVDDNLNGWSTYTRN